MVVGDLLKNLALDRWYKLLIFVGIILLIVSLTIEVKALNNESVLYLSLGFLFIGVGEWKNEKIEVELKSPNAYTGSGAIFQHPVRKPDLIGNILLLVGVIFIILFVLGYFNKISI